VPEPGSVVLREVTADNRAAVEALAVAPGQDRFSPGVSASLLEAAETPGPSRREA